MAGPINDIRELDLQIPTDERSFKTWLHRNFALIKNMLSPVVIIRTTFAGLDGLIIKDPNGNNRIKLRLDGIGRSKLVLNSPTNIETGVIGGDGDPEGNVTASVGFIYLRTDGGPGSTFYVKESGTGNTGWVAK